MAVFAETRSYVNFGAVPKGDKRPVLWPVLVHRVLYPEAKRPQLNLFQRAVLGLIRARTAQPETIAELTGLHQNLINLILAQGVTDGWLVDGAGALTSKGEKTLDDEAVDDGNLKSGYLLQDTLTGRFWPRLIAELNQMEPRDPLARYPEFTDERKTGHTIKPFMIKSGKSDLAALDHDSLMLAYRDYREDYRASQQLDQSSWARRLAKGALVHLASHSELWQRQTLSGVIPKKVLARFSEDDYGIYENRVYARLLDKTERHLRGRLSALKGLQATLDQALKLYESEGVDFRLSREVCRLWGDTFDQAATSRVSELLSQTLGSLESLFRVISGLRQSGVYLLVSRQAQVVGALHLTNILSHDPHYRHLALLWDLLDQSTSATRSSPEERFSRNQYFADAYSRYAGLVLRHALRPYLAEQYEGIWAGRCIRLQQSGLDWQLVSVVSGEHDSEEVLLTVVPWLADAHLLDESLQLPLERFIAWPAIGQEPQQAAYHGQWVPLSPSDMYCVERFGLLVDRALYRMVVRSYGQPLTKIPVKALVVADGINGLHVDRQNHALELREAISRDSITALKGALVAANSSRQAEALERHNQEIIALEKCPVCETRGDLFFQSPIGFRANCDECGTERYLRREGTQLVFDQTVSGRKDFVALGRRAFAFDVSRIAASIGLR